MQYISEQLLEKLDLERNKLTIMKEKLRKYASQFTQLEVQYCLLTSGNNNSSSVGNNTAGRRHHSVDSSASAASNNNSGGGFLGMLKRTASTSSATDFHLDIPMISEPVEGTGDETEGIVLQYKELLNEVAEDLGDGKDAAPASSTTEEEDVERRLRQKSSSTSSLSPVNASGTEKTNTMIQPKKSFRVIERKASNNNMNKNEEK